MLTNCSKYALRNEPLSTWFTTLRLSHRFTLPSITSFALSQLTLHPSTHHLSLVSRIKLYMDNAVPPQYLIPLFAELCALPKILSMDEVKALHPDLMMRVMMVREKVRTGDHGLSGLRAEDVEDVVREVFEIDT